MPRQRLTIGTFGDITTRKLPSGRFAARTRYRDWDGHARLVQASGTTAKAAERALKAKIADRDLFQPADTSLTPDSLFSDLVTYWSSAFGVLSAELRRAEAHHFDVESRSLTQSLHAGSTTPRMWRQSCALGSRLPSRVALARGDCA